MKIFFAVAFLGMLGFAASFIPPKTPESFSNIRSGAIVGGFTRGEYMVNDPEAFELLWKQLEPNRSAPKINFETETVIGVIMGNRTAKEYATRIATVEVNDTDTLVLVQETAPTEGCESPRSLFAPYHLIRIPKTEKPVRFSYQVTSAPCR